MRISSKKNVRAPFIIQLAKASLVSYLACMTMQAELLSVNVGTPDLLHWQGKEIETSIVKKPLPDAAFPVQIAKWNLKGDKQADLSVHGGRDKAVYAYPFEHYEWWKKELGSHERLEAPAAFGENLTLRGILEEDVRIGDCFSLGSARLIVTQPRTPCHKLNALYQRNDMVKRFHESLRVGFYLTVAEEGSFAKDDRLVLLTREDEALTIPEIYLLYTGQTRDSEALDRALANPHLSGSWRRKLSSLKKDR